MRCPKCGHHKTAVSNTRTCHVGKAIHRYRTCLECTFRFYTLEERIMDRSSKAVLQERLLTHVDALRESIMFEIKRVIKE